MLLLQVYEGGNFCPSTFCLFLLLCECWILQKAQEVSVTLWVLGITSFKGKRLKYPLFWLSLQSEHGGQWVYPRCSKFQFFLCEVVGTSSAPPPQLLKKKKVLALIHKVAVISTPQHLGDSSDAHTSTLVSTPTKKNPDTLMQKWSPSIFRQCRQTAP